MRMKKSTIQKWTILLMMGMTSRRKFPSTLRKFLATIGTGECCPHIFWLQVFSRFVTQIICGWKKNLFALNFLRYRDESDYALKFMESSWKDLQKEEARR